MSDSLNDFLIRVSNDPKLAEYFTEVARAIDQAGLSPEEQAAVLSRDGGRIRRLLGDKPFIFMILQWFRDEPKR